MKMNQVDQPTAIFYTIPLVNAESKSSLKTAVLKAKRLVSMSQPVYQPYMEQFLKFCEAHKSVIDRFGRYPTRNATLGRVSTVEEQQYLKELQSSTQQQ